MYREPQFAPAGEGGEINKIKKDKPVEANDNIASAINYLKDNGHFLLPESHNKKGQETYSKIQEMRNSSDNFFVKFKADQVLSKPLDNWSIFLKRSLLKSEWRNIISDNYFYEIFNNKDPWEFQNINPMDKDTLSEKEIEYIFDKYRSLMPDYFCWQENGARQDKFNDLGLRSDYHIEEPDPYSSGTTRGTSVAKLSDKYGSIYTFEGNIATFFKLDEELEEQRKEKTNKFGKISESNLYFFINKFKKAIENNNIEDLLDYYKIRKLLPESLIKEFEDSLGYSPPAEIDKDYYKKLNFEDDIEALKPELIKKFGKNEKYKDFEILSSKLDSLLVERRDLAKKKNFGFSSENPEILDFFCSFVRKHPEKLMGHKHFSISYYLYLRDKLPGDIVEEFEERFNITIPKSAQKFDTFDDYMSLTDSEKLSPFISETINFKEISEWLYEKIQELSDKIKSSKKVPQILSLDDILKEEGFDKNKISEEEYKKTLLTYQTLIELPFREKIEEEFGINLADYNIREQIQFVNFLSTKTEEEVEQVKEFLNQGEDGQAKTNRIKSFLSLEQGQEIGEVILSLGDELKDQLEVADKLFDEYARMVESANETIEEVTKMYKEIFFEKELDKNEIMQTILKRASDLFLIAQEKLNNADESEKEKIVNDLIDDLSRQNKINKRTIDSLKETAEELNLLYGEIGDELLGEEIISGLKDIREEAKEKGQEGLFEKMEEEHIKHKKYDSQRLKESIDTYKDMYTLSDSMATTIKEVTGKTDMDIQKIRQSLEEDKPKYEPTVKKLEKLLVVQVNLENKLDELIYGYKTPELPEGVESNVADLIFKKYGEIIKVAQRSKKEFGEIFKDESIINSEEIDDIVEEMLFKAKELLENNIKKIADGEIDEKSLIEGLEEHKIELLSAVSTYKVMSKNNKMNPENLKDVKYEEITAGEYFGDSSLVDVVEKSFKKQYGAPGKMAMPTIKDITKQDQQRLQEFWEMLNIYKKNWENYPARGEKFIEALIDKFKNNNADTTIYDYKYKKDPIAFLRIDSLDDGSKYFASFNAQDTTRGYAIGSALLNNVLNEVGKKSDVRAVVVPKERILATYINKFDFILNGIDMDCIDSGKPMVKIERKCKNDKKYHYKDYKTEDIIHEYNENSFKKKNNKIKYFVERFDLSDEKKMSQKIESILTDGYICAKCAFKQEENKAYFAFEK